MVVSVPQRERDGKLSVGKAGTCRSQGRTKVHEGAGREDYLWCEQAHGAEKGPWVAEFASLY